jgi:hypothetical protein
MASSSGDHLRAVVSLACGDECVERISGVADGEVELRGLASA